MAVKRVVITGASSGIGAATAEAFAATGAHLVLAARGQAGLDDVVDRCRTAGGTAEAFVTDVTDAAAVARLANHAQRAMGGIDLWFSNVGIGTVGRFHEVPIAEHDAVVAANLVGHMHDAHAVLPIFLAQRRGVFVNMISVGGYLATPYAAAYSASKFGSRGFSQALRAELSGEPDIHICDVYPTFVDTPGLTHAGNHTGGKLSVPPGVLDPRGVARAVVRLADRPRATTVIGAPAPMMVLAQALVPNLAASAMNGFLARYFARADGAPATSGSLHASPADASGIDGGLRRPDQRRQAVIAACGMGAVAALALSGWWLARSRR